MLRNPLSYTKSEIEHLNPEEDGRNMLHSALLKGDSVAVKQYLELGANPMSRDEKYNRNCVGWAAEGGNLECLQLLKQYMDASQWKSSFHESDKFDNFPIHLAARSSNDTELFSFIHIEGNHNLLEIGQHGCGLFHYIFLRKNNFAIFEYINKHLPSSERDKCLISLRNNEDFPPITWYILKKCIDGVKAVINLPELDIDQPSSKSFISPLIAACQFDNIELIKLLLDHGADVGFQDGRNKTPLICALEYSPPHCDIAKLLLKYGADINQIQFEGFTPLHLYIKYFSENIDSIIFLLKHGAASSIFQEDIYGYRPMEWLKTDINPYLEKLASFLDPAIINQLKNSYRKQAKVVNGNVLFKHLSAIYPSIKEYVDGGTCNAYGPLVALSYFDNNCDLSPFYNNLEKAINDASCNKPTYDLERWANDMVWLQSSEETKKSIFVKPNGKSNVRPRYYDFFSPTDRKKIFSYVTDRQIDGRFSPISYFFRVKFNGRHWISPQLEHALEKRCREDAYLEIKSERHANYLIKRGDKFIFIEENCDNKITKPLDVKEAVNLIIYYQSTCSPGSKYDYQGIFPLHICSWKFDSPSLEKVSTDDSELKGELINYIESDKEVFKHFTALKGAHLLHFCASHDDVTTMKVLLEINKELDINIPCKKGGSRPLHIAVINNAYNCVKFLLEQDNIDIYCKNINGDYMLTAAYENQKMTDLILECLLKKGISPNNLVKDNFNFRLFALVGGDKDLIDRLFTKDEFEYYRKIKKF